MLKKQSVGTWLNAIVVVLTLVSLIVYGVNISSEGYFKNASVTNLILYGVIAMVMLAAVIVLAQGKLEAAHPLSGEPSERKSGRSWIHFLLQCRCASGGTDPCKYVFCDRNHCKYGVPWNRSSCSNGSSIFQS